uniref:Helicase C-terminal domain-containing protein n=1 Tax=Alexandrium andersonii TaxID=327968 RepID=A0A7S2F844_9DINO
MFMGKNDEQDEKKRREALLKWVRTELKHDEAVLLLCHPGTVKRLVADQELIKLLGSAPQVMDGGLDEAEEQDESNRQSVHAEQAPRWDHWDEYQRFVKGEVRWLVKTFALGARGLDYSQTTVVPEMAHQLSLAVILFDFPMTMMEYIHCIGRTHRGRQKDGRAVVFMSEGRFWMAGELLALLERCNQSIPEDLKELVDNNEALLRECRQAMLLLKNGDSPLSAFRDAGTGTASSFNMGSLFDADKRLWSLPPDVTRYQRRLIHALAHEEELPHVSTTTGEGRRLHIAPDRNNLPDKFFLEGEEVVQAREDAQGQGVGRQGRVVDPKIHPWKRTVGVRFDGEAKDGFISADLLELRSVSSTAVLEV